MKTHQWICQRQTASRFALTGKSRPIIRERRWKPKLHGSLPTFLHPDLAILTLECIKLLPGNCLDPLPAAIDGRAQSR